jgi:hypothetical protein
MPNDRSIIVEIDMRIRFNLPSLALAVSLLIAPMAAQSQSKDMTDRDFSLLPTFCKTRLRGSPEEWKPLVARLGRDTFEDIHHFCFGLYFQNKARFAFKKTDKAHFWRRSVGEFDYVLRHWPPNEPMRPEAESAKRQSEFMLKQIR